jgi:hypothetical protein
MKAESERGSRRDAETLGGRVCLRSLRPPIHDRREGLTGGNRSVVRRCRGRLTGVLVVLAILGVLLVGGTIGEAGQAASPPARARLAVLAFAGAGGPEGMGDALSQVMRDGLRQIRGVELVEPAALGAAVAFARGRPVR